MDNITLPGSLEPVTDVAPIEFASAEDIKKLFDALNPVERKETATPEDISNRVNAATNTLINQAENDPTLLDSAMIVYEHPCSYDMSRYYLYAEKVYEKVCERISNANVDIKIKLALRDFSDLGFPRSSDITAPAKSIRVSVFDKKDFLDIEILMEYYPNISRTFISRISYNKPVF